jgi:hypothetical protein
MSPRTFVAIAACALASPFGAHAATCEWSHRFANDIVSYGAKAAASENELEARRSAREARPAAFDAAKEAKSCGCPAAIPLFEEAALQAMYADRAANLTAIRQYGVRIKALGEKALDTLRRCPTS